MEFIKSGLYHKLTVARDMLERDEVELASVASIIRDILLVKMELYHCLTRPYLKTEYIKLSKCFALKTLVNTLSSLVEAPKKMNENINKQIIWNNILLQMHSSV